MKAFAQGIVRNVAAATVLGVGAFSLPGAAAGHVTKLPTCSHVRSVLGTTLPITGDVTGEGDLGASLTCNYGPTLSVELQPGVGVGYFDSDRAGTSKAKTVAALGTKAFSATLTITAKNVKTSYVELEVLQGSEILKIISSKFTLAMDEVLAKKLLPLA